MAAPFVTGTVALLASAFPDESVSQRIARVLRSVDDVPALTGKCVTGGRLNVATALRTWGDIVGRVTNGSGAGIDSAYVKAFDESGNFVADSFTDSNGAYTVGPLAAGDYRLWFSDGSATYAGEFYNDHVAFSDDPVSLAGADRISVTAGQTTSGIDVVMDAFGHISGTVTNRAGVPLEGIGVEAYDDVGIRSETHTDVNGNYNLAGLIGGAYRLKYWDWRGNYYQEYYHNKSSQVAADPVAVTLSLTHNGVDVILAGSDDITGRVTDGSGRPLEGILVSAAERVYPNPDTGSDYTDADGLYGIGGLDVSYYNVSFKDLSGDHLTIYDSGVDRGILVEADQTTDGVNAELPDAGHIKGRVIDADGRALSGALVAASPLDQGGGVSAYADSDGYYDIGWLTGGDYRVSFSQPDYRQEYFSGHTTPDSADPVRVNVTETTGNIDASLERYGHITGRVTDSAGSGLSDVYVYAYDEAGESVNADRTSGGYYDIGGLATGRYRLEFRHRYGAYRPEYYHDQATLETANPLSVTLGMITSGIDASLEQTPNSHVTGTVTSNDGRVLRGIRVTAYNESGATVTYTGTNEYGKFDLDVGQGGTFRIGFHEYNNYPYTDYFGYAAEYHSDKPTLDAADPVSIGPGETVAGLDAALVPTYGSISGNMCDADGRWLNGSVAAYDANGIQVGWANASLGFYRISGLIGGSYRLRFTARLHRSEFYNDKATLADADVLAVSPGLTSQAATAFLESSVGIAGRVTNRGGLPVPKVGVTVYDESGSVVDHASTDAAGMYGIRALPDGVYRLGFSPDGGTYASEYYNDKATLDSADAVEVTSGQTTSDVDVELALAGHIIGKVTDSAGRAIFDVDVYAYDAAGEVVGSASTDAGGEYDIDGLEGGAYRVYFDRDYSTYLSEYWNDKTSLAAADPVFVTVSNTTDHVDASLAAMGHIEGRVTNQAGMPLESIYVTAYSAAGQPVGGDRTDADGRYDLPLMGGQYRVKFGNDDNNTYVEEYYDDALTLEDATSVTVTLDYSTGGVDARLDLASRFTGSVTNASGQPLSQAQVVVYSSNGDYVASTATDADGHYEIRGLRSGDYRLGVWHSGAYVDEFFNDRLTLASADPLALGVGESKTVDVALANAGHITGTVKDASGAGIDSAWVLAYRWIGNSWSIVASASVDTDGAYDLGGLTTGTYRIQFSALGGYLSEYYADAATVEAAEDVPVTAAQTTPGIDAVLDTPGHITGTVTDASGAGIASMYVDVYRQAAGDWVYAGSGPTDTTGAYDVGGLTAGTYRVQFSAPSSYLSEWWDDQPDVEHATDVTVTTGETTPGIDAVLATAAHITGTVTDASGAGIAFIDVRAYRQAAGDWVYAGSGRTDTTGAYAVAGLTTGTYRVHFSAPSSYLSEWWDDQPDVEHATDVTVTTGETTPGIDAVLATAAHITGTVTDASGAGIASMYVDVYRQTAGDWVYAGSGTTDTSGAYDVGGLMAGTYRVFFAGYWGGYFSEWWDDAADGASAVEIVVADGETRSGIDAVLDTSGHITGTVTDASGAGIASMYVDVYRLSGGSWNYAGYAYTDTAGAYDVGGLTTGTYRVHFSAPSSYLSEWWDDQPDVEHATDVTVTTGETTPGIDAVLDTPGHITGTVTDASGAGIASMYVDVYRQTAGDWVYAGSGPTDTSGAYDVGGLRAGTYRVFFAGYWGGYFSEWWDDQPDLEHATDVTVTTGETTPGIDAVLNRGGTISGRVTDTDDRPLRYRQVRLYGNGDTFYAWTDSQGRYSATGLQPGDYEVYFDGGDRSYVSEWYQDKADRASADPVTVGLDQDVTGVDAVLEEYGGRLSGTVADTAGAPLEGIRVVAYRRDGHGGWDYMRDTSTASTGSYAMRGLTEGTYRVAFYDRSQTYLDEFFDDKRDFDAADSIEVIGGATASGIDAQLTRASKVAGTVTSDAGEPLRHIWVAAYRSDGDGGWEYLSDASTDAAGRYAVRGLAAGTYRIGFFDYSRPGQWASEYFDNAISIFEARNVPLAAEGTATVDVSLSPGGSIAGTARDSSGAAAALTSVAAYRDSEQGTWTYVADATTDETGAYRLSGLATGAYRLRFGARGDFLPEWYQDASRVEDATDVLVSAGAETPAIDPILSRGATVSGTVTSSSGALANAGVTAYRETASGGWQYAADATTDQLGHYDLRQLPSGRYKVRFDEPQSSTLIGEWYDDKATRDEADTLTVGDEAQVSGVDAELAESPAILGVVSADAGGVVGGVRVYAYQEDPVEGWTYVADATTDATGAYALRPLWPGSYRVVFSPGDAALDLAPEVWNDKAVVQLGDPVTIGAGETVTDISPSLAAAAHLLGTVTDPLGLPSAAPPFAPISMVYQVYGHSWARPRPPPTAPTTSAACPPATTRCGSRTPATTRPSGTRTRRAGARPMSSPWPPASIRVRWTPCSVSRRSCRA